MADSLIERIIAPIESAPRSGQALLLYGLVRSVVASGDRALLALDRLPQLSVENRALVYELLEAYASGGIAGPEWDAALARLDRIIQGA